MPAVTVEVVLVQHAEKDTGAGDPRLTERGISQAREVAEMLLQHHWDALFCSGALRARQTAEIIGARCGLVPIVDDRFRERMNWGDAPCPQTRAEFLGDWGRATMERSWTPPSGSSSLATGARMRAALDELCERATVRAGLIVTHGGATVDLLRTLVADDALETMLPGCIDGGIPHGGLTRLTYEAGWRVRQVGASRLAE